LVYNRIKIIPDSFLNIAIYAGEKTLPGNQQFALLGTTAVETCS